MKNKKEVTVTDVYTRLSEDGWITHIATIYDDPKEDEIEDALQFLGIKNINDIFNEKD